VGASIRWILLLPMMGWSWEGWLTEGAYSLVCTLNHIPKVLYFTEVKASVCENISHTDLTRGSKPEPSEWQSYPETTKSPCMHKIVT
jgi:hypothetical protein